MAREDRVRADGTVECLVNDRAVTTSAPASTVALDFLRAHERLSGVKEGCREGDCGACTVLLGELRGDHVEYRAVCACLLPIGDAQGKHLVTVEGLTQSDGLSPVQRLLVDEGAVQCGFCTPGFVVSLTGYLLSGGAPAGDARGRGGRRQPVPVHRPRADRPSGPTPGGGDLIESRQPGAFPRRPRGGPGVLP